MVSTLSSRPTNFTNVVTEYIGQIHRVTSNESYWHCFPDAEDEDAMKNCRDTDEINFEIKVISQKPKVFTIQNVCIYTYKF